MTVSIQADELYHSMQKFELSPWRIMTL